MTHCFIKKRTVLRKKNIHIQVTKEGATLLVNAVCLISEPLSKPLNLQTIYALEVNEK